MFEGPKGRVASISIKQPWAELIISGKKAIEVRTWSTRYRGPMWLHTGISANIEIEKSFGFSNLFHGGYVGRFTLEEIIPFNESNWKKWRSLHLDAGDYRLGLNAWILSNPVRFKKPISAKGDRLLFLPDGETDDLLKKALEEAIQLGL